MYEYTNLREKPQLKEKAAEWFHGKWGVPEAAYLECINAFLNKETEYGWYLCLDDEKIVGGLGVIENDFHDRKDLTPNVCAVYRGSIPWQRHCRKFVEYGSGRFKRQRYFTDLLNYRSYKLL